MVRCLEPRNFSGSTVFFFVLFFPWLLHEFIEATMINLYYFKLVNPAVMHIALCLIFDHRIRQFVLAVKSCSVGHLSIKLL